MCSHKMAVILKLIFVVMLINVVCQILWHFCHVFLELCNCLLERQIDTEILLKQSAETFVRWSCRKPAG